MQKHEDIPPKAAKPEATEKEEGEEEEEEKGMAGSIDCMSQQQEEVRSLRARGAELEESLAKARSGLASAQERREFMQEEAEQVPFSFVLFLLFFCFASQDDFFSAEH